MIVPFALALVGCDDPPGPRRPARTAAPAVKQSSAPAKISPVLPGPLPGCQGTSIDPPTAVLERAGQLFQAGEPIKTVNMLHELAKAHPQSATVRFRLAETLTRIDPPQRARAIPMFEEALRLHDDGCRLAEPVEWQALEGIAIAHMDEGHFDRALPYLRRAANRWPASGSMHYNLACALCKTGDRDGCIREIEAALEASNGPAPEFLMGRVPPASHYVELAPRDPDLAPVRRDPRFVALLKRYR